MLLVSNKSFLGLTNRFWAESLAGIRGMIISKRKEREEEEEEEEESTAECFWIKSREVPLDESPRKIEKNPGGSCNASCGRTVNC